MQRLHQVGAAVKDFDATERFYQEVLGAQYLARFEPPGLLFFQFAGVRLVFEAGNKPANLYFWVDDIDAEYARLIAAGVEFAAPPAIIHKDDLGTFGPVGNAEWMAFFSDPGGNTLALATQK
ncbi:MAG: hypothetical protein GKR90_00595 [Pseudomonadales bacterium]|nr:hypothetical protein [Pseudomonadales bacterium]